MDTNTSRITKRPKRVPQHADPWSFQRSQPIEQVAGIGGRLLSDRTHKRNHRQINMPAIKFPDDDPDNPPLTPSMLLELRRRVAAEISKYRTSGECSALDIALVEAIWRDGTTLRAYARARGVTPAAIGDHIERLRYRCPRFYLYWLWKNRRRRGPKGS